MANSRKPVERLGYPSDYKERSFNLAEDAKWGGFINVRVEDALKVRFQDWLESYPGESALILEELLAAGMKVTLAYDQANDSWLCSFTGKLLSESSERYVMTTRAGSMSEVVALACWKHVYLVKGAYSKIAKTGHPLWG